MRTTSMWFESGNIPPNAAVQMGVNRVGTFPYHCLNHPWIAGTIVVP